MTDVIIPTYRPSDELLKTLEMLDEQSVKPGKIIIMDTVSGTAAGAKELIDGSGAAFSVPVEIHTVDKAEFDHGRTRNQGASYSDADIIVYMTQDAVPVDGSFIEALIRPLSDDKVAVSYARQLPKADCIPEERITRGFNYPDTSVLKSESDLSSLGIKTYFCSNVSCAYKRDVFDALGGFTDKTIFNEDMIFACSVIKAGYKISYTADAGVYHSHNYTAKQQFRRNVDIGISQALHPEVFSGLSSESEGKKLVKTTVRELRKNGHAGRIPGYLWTTGCRYAGFLIGKNHRHFPKGFIKKVSMNPGFFG